MEMKIENIFNDMSIEQLKATINKLQDIIKKRQEKEDKVLLNTLYPLLKIAIDKHLIFYNDFVIDYCAYNKQQGFIDLSDDSY